MSHQAYPYIITSQPNTLVVSLADMKKHLKIDSDTTDDEYIESLISTATKYVENYIKRELLTKSFKTYRDCFFEPNKLRRSKLQKINSIQYLLDGSLTVFNSSNYYFDDQVDYSSIYLEENASFPSPIDTKKQAVVINFQAGYGFPVSSATRSTNVVTITTESDHNFSSGDEIIIAGAISPADNDFNGAQTILVLSSTTFTYSNTGADETATGIITANKIPFELLGAIKVIVACLYANRGDCSGDNASLKVDGCIDPSLRNLLNFYKIIEVTV